MNRIQLFEDFVVEMYKEVPYNVKIAGEYKIKAGSQPEMIVRVAGFERQGDDTDSLYLMDSDPAKLKLGSLIVKNADMRKLEKGTAVKATTTKGEDVKITRIGNLSVNENMTPLAKYYNNYKSNQDFMKIAVEIDEIINSATFIEDSSRNRILDLITDLVEAYADETIDDYKAKRG